MNTDLYWWVTAYASIRYRRISHEIEDLVDTLKTKVESEDPATAARVEQYIEDQKKRFYQQSIGLRPE